MAVTRNKVSRSVAFGAVLASAAALAVGCTGTIGGSVGATNDDATAAGGKGSTPGAAPVATGASKLDTSLPCEVEDVQDSPLRRLSHVEYRRTLADLFPTVDLPRPHLVDDLRVHGFENNARALNPSDALIGNYEGHASIVAERVVRDAFAEVVTCDPEPDPEACARTFVTEFGERAFRRPLTAAEVDRYVGFLVGQLADVSFASAVELTLQAVLQSPQFLYRLEIVDDDASGDVVALDDLELATRLSFLIWQSMPDESLRARAKRGDLHTKAQLAEAAEHLLEDPRASVAFGDFQRQWLHLDKVLEEVKNADQFPDWSPDLRDELADESVRFAERLYAEGDATVEALLTSRRAVVNGRVGAHYGVTVDGDGWQDVMLPEGERAGILTRSAFLAGRARPTNGSPPLRGVAVLEHLLCNPPPAPPADVDTSITITEGDPRTNRERFEEKTSQGSCYGCHEAIDGVGMTFEHYDSTGAYRALDNGYAVDATATVAGTDVDGPVQDAVELSRQLAASDQVKACMAVNWYRYAFGRDERPNEWCKVGVMTQSLIDSGGDFRKMILTIVASDEFSSKKAP